MIIDSSSVGMTSTRSYSSYFQAEKSQLITRKSIADKLGLSELAEKNSDEKTGSQSSAADQTQSSASQAAAGQSVEVQTAAAGYSAEYQVSTAMTASSGKTAVDQLQEAASDIDKQERAQQKENDAAAISEMLSSQSSGSLNQINRMMAASKTSDFGTQVESEEDMKMKILNTLLDALKGGGKGHRGGRHGHGMGGHGFSSMKGMSGMMAAYGGMGQEASLSSISMLAGQEGQVSHGEPGASLWTKTTAQSAFFAETENTTFSTSGTVTTADGREINFGIDLEMSRSFCARYDSLAQEDYIYTDPLIFNMEGNDAAGITDQKFLFDIDSDGEEESISFAAQGSGFLALDKNGDGKINDGSELFGTQSGDGFKDLAQYDSDGNGWIDEADEVFKDLKIWSKDENGNDSLVSLKEAGIGALYLGSTDTEFSINDASTNASNAVVRKTGFYLKEDGSAGIMQHVDLTT